MPAWLASNTEQVGCPNTDNIGAKIITNAISGVLIIIITVENTPKPYSN